MAAMIEKPSTAEAAIPVALPPPTTDPEKALEAQNTSDTPPIDTNLVTWATDDPEHPKNWSQKRKWALTLLLSCSGTVCLTSSTMLAPALPTIANDFHISQASANMAMSIFVLAFAFGPMLVAPFAEVFGRRNIWLIGSTWYVVWNLACGFTDGHGLLLAARLFAGLGSSVEFVVGGICVQRYRSILISLCRSTRQSSETSGRLSSEVSPSPYPLSFPSSGLRSVLYWEVL